MALCIYAGILLHLSFALTLVVVCISFFGLVSFGASSLDCHRKPYLASCLAGASSSPDDSLHEADLKELVGGCGFPVPLARICVRCSILFLCTAKIRLGWIWFSLAETAGDIDTSSQFWSLVWSEVDQSL